MARDPLPTVARIRRQAHEEAVATLARTLAAEAEAEALAKQAERVIATETSAAAAPDGDDGVVEAFAAWLPGARLRAALARQACERTQAEVARARAALALTRTALETVATLMAERAQMRQAAAARAELLALDEAAAAQRIAEGGQESAGQAAGDPA